MGGGPSSTLSALIPPQPGGTWHIYGTETAASGLPEPTVWSSPDGVTWQATPLDTLPLEGVIAGAALYNGETVVVGSVGTGASAHAAVWLSAEPGAPFNRVSVSTGAGPSQMSAVTAGPLGFFAIGTSDGSFVMWSSVSGQQWSPNTAADRVIDASPGAHVNTLVSIGTTVYAGGSVPNGPSTQAAVWSSGDGLTWGLIGYGSKAFAGTGNEEIFSIAPLTRGLVAVGGVNFGSGWVPASWIFPNGVSWSQPSTDFPVTSSEAPSPYGPSGGMAAFDVSGIAGSTGQTALVAAGGGPDSQAVWRSADGLHWTTGGLPNADASLGTWRATAVAATYSTTVVLDTSPGQPYVLAATLKGWAQPSSNPAVFGPIQPLAVPLALTQVAGTLILDADEVVFPQSIGPATVSDKTFSSSDGLTWTAQSPSSPFPPTLPAPSAVTSRLGSGWVALGTGTSGLPETWTSANGNNWQSQGLLQSAAAASGTASVNGICSVAASASKQAGSTTTLPAASPTATAPASQPGPSLVVAVGSAPQPAQSSNHPSTLPLGIEAQAWYSRNGGSWKQGTISPAPALGGTESMSGCVDVAGTLVAFGTSTLANGIPVPAVWKSTNGVAWVRSRVSSFVPGAANPIISLAGSGPDWIAVANPDPGADPGAPGPTPSAGGVGPAASTGSDAGLGFPLSLAPATDGLWFSADAGDSWQVLPTYGSPWLGTEDSKLDLVTFESATAVVAGTVDGELAVWVGSLSGVASSQSTTIAP